MQFIYFLNNHASIVITACILLGILCYVFGIRMVRHGEKIWSAMILNYGNAAFFFAFFTFLCAKGFLN